MIADIIVGVVLLVSSIIAFLRGFIREVLTIVGVLGALAAAYFGGPVLAPIFADWFGVVPDSDPPQRLFDIVPLTLLADGASYASIFIVVVVALSLTSHLLAEAAKSLGLGPLDRTLGVLFGLIRGVVLISVMYIPLHLLNDEKAKALLFENSHTHFYLEHIAEFTVQYLPEGAQGPDSSDGIDVEAVQDSARENLQTIDLLKKEGLSNDDVERLEGAARDAVEGYSEEFRENMQQLIEDADQAISEEIAPTQPTQTEGENAQ